jgi:hypothetical protein
MKEYKLAPNRQDRIVGRVKPRELETIIVCGSAHAIVTIDDVKD